MSTQTRRAVQYIRMSTDRQDLSPVTQKQAIAAFAAANGFDIISSYEDDGKSGLHISNRPSLRKLLADVVKDALFTEILVYDISRWGRFQDPDAGAYYEYQCRLHGVQVIFTNESFANDMTTANFLLKSMKRVMAAEYSRDLAYKARAGQQRVISMGFHMGALPSLGYRRCSVSSDGKRQLLLEHGQRKAALTDRIEWVLGPEPEVALVRRICSSYVSGLQLDEIAGLVHAEGWRSEKGRVVSMLTIKILLRNEALIGNFVWGVKSKGGKIINSVPSRMNGSVPRIIDDSTWASIQERLMRPATQHGSQIADARSRDEPKKRARKPRQLRLALTGYSPRATYRRSLGSPQQLRDHTREFGRALCTALTAVGLPAGFDSKNNVLTFWSARLRVRLMWPSDTGTWVAPRNRSTLEVQHVVVARMMMLYRPKDFFVLPSKCMETAFSRELQSDVPKRLMQYWCESPEHLINQLSRISKSQPEVNSPTSARAPDGNSQSAKLK